ncbi:diguanylate cyclase [uncultured Methylibium sp.]|uniref:diguanylate cyclase domain-containing protein n=1 Tax=uncultured Methylibium sp. TaxID=381093 RepID=UPI0025CFB32F|nr:diguanylate cyclase [uncultured Methylibium sp.]
MRIRLLLIATAASALVLCAGAFVVGVRTAQEADRLDAAQTEAQTAAREASALLALSQDYLLHESPRAARQWHTRHASLAQALQDGDGLPASALQTLQALRATHAGLRDLFAKLEATAAAGPTPLALAQREMLADHLLVGTQSIADGVHQVAEELAAQRRNSEQQRRSLVRASAIAVMLVLAGLAFLIERRVLRPLRLLQAGTQLVHAGDLSARCDDQAQDEFGDLARDFNAMTQALASRNDELQEKERKLRALTERLPAMVAFVDRDQRYRFCSAQYERSFGIPVQEIVGRSIGDLLGPAVQAALQPRVRAALAGTPQRFESPLEVRGRSITVLCEFTPEHDAAGAVTGFYVMALDISERRAAELQLVEALAWKRAMLDSAGFGVIAVDTTGVIRSVNPAALDMLGYRADELIGTATPERLHDPAELAARAAELSAEFGRPITPLQALGAKARLGPPDEREWTYLRKDGSRFPVGLTVSAIRADAGRITGYLALAIDITERKRAEETIRHLAHHDPLTGLPNRSLLADRLDVALRRAQRNGERVAVMALDLDHFKRINDTLGHAAGDRLLQAVAERLLASVRPSDTVARMGGDEFVVLLDGIRGSADIEPIASAILQRMAQPVVDGPNELLVTTSLGVAVYPDSAATAAVLLEQADAAMYEAKSAGRNTFRLFRTLLPA